MGKKNRNKGGRRDKYDDMFADAGGNDYDDYQDYIRDEDYQYSYQSEIDSAEFVDIGENADDDENNDEDGNENDGNEWRYSKETPDKKPSIEQKKTEAEAALKEEAAQTSASPKVKSMASEEREAWDLVREKTDEKKNDAEEKPKGPGIFAKLTGSLAGLFGKKAENTQENADGENLKSEQPAEKESGKDSETNKEKDEKEQKKPNTENVNETPETEEAPKSGIFKKLSFIGGKTFSAGKAVGKKIAKMSKSLLTRKKKLKEEEETLSEFGAQSENTLPTETNTEKNTEKKETPPKTENGVPGVPDKTPEEEAREKRKTYLILGASTVAAALLLLTAAMLWRVSETGGGEKKTAQKLDSASTEIPNETALAEQESGPEFSDNSADLSIPETESSELLPATKEKTESDLGKSELPDIPETLLDSSETEQTKESADSTGLDISNPPELSMDEPSATENSLKQELDGIGAGTETALDALEISNGSSEKPADDNIPAVEEENPLAALAAETKISAEDEISDDTTVGEILDKEPENETATLNDTAENTLKQPPEDAEKTSDEETDDPFAELAISDNPDENRSANDLLDTLPAAETNSPNAESEKALASTDLQDSSNPDFVSLEPTLATNGEREPIPDSLQTPDGISSGSNVEGWEESTEEEPVSPSVAEIEQIPSPQEKKDTDSLNGDVAEENNLSVPEPALELDELNTEENTELNTEEKAEKNVDTLETPETDSALSMEETPVSQESDSLLAPPALGNLAPEQEKISEDPLAELDELSLETSDEPTGVSSEPGELSAGNSDESSAKDEMPLKNELTAESENKTTETESGTDPLTGLDISDPLTDDSAEISEPLNPEENSSEETSNNQPSQSSEMTPESPFDGILTPESEGSNSKIGGLDDLENINKNGDLLIPQNAQNSQFDLNSEIKERKENDTKKTNSAKNTKYSSYIVLEGDTYREISEKFYGSPAYKEALARYNSDVVPDSNNLKTGMTLQIPELEFLRSCFPTLCPQSAQVVYVPSEGSNEAQTIQFYVVEKGDTLSELAERILGDASRWPEIYRLNSEKIQDLDILPAGEKLQIPVENSDTPSKFWK